MSKAPGTFDVLSPTVFPPVAIVTSVLLTVLSEVLTADLFEVSVADMPSCTEVSLFAVFVFEHHAIAKLRATVVSHTHILFLFLFIMHLVSKMEFLFIDCII